MTSKNILVTGPPRCGKSTLIEKVILRIEKPMTGFFYLIGSISQKGDRFIQKIKERDDVVLTHVSKKNRDWLADSLFLEAQRDV